MAGMTDAQFQQLESMVGALGVDQSNADADVAALPGLVAASQAAQTAEAQGRADLAESTSAVSADVQAIQAFLASISNGTTPPAPGPEATAGTGNKAPSTGPKR